MRLSPFAFFPDRIEIPETDDLPGLRQLVATARAKRPDVAVAKLRDQTAEISVRRWGRFCGAIFQIIRPTSHLAKYTVSQIRSRISRNRSLTRRSRNQTNRVFDRRDAENAEKSERKTSSTERAGFASSPERARRSRRKDSANSGKNSTRYVVTAAAPIGAARVSKRYP
jgi:hypothetical protein